MAKVWFGREVSVPTVGAPAYGDLPLAQCIDQLGLTKRHWLHGLDLTLRFDSRKARAAAVPEPRHAVCQVDEREASEEVWMAGYYLLEITPQEVANRLGPPA